MAQSASRKRKLVEDSTAGAKRNKESLVSFFGDDSEREENVPEGDYKFTCPYKNRLYQKLTCNLYCFCFLLECTGRGNTPRKSHVFQPNDSKSFHETSP